jgi:hypothetical protein
MCVHVRAVGVCVSHLLLELLVVNPSSYYRQRSPEHLQHWYGVRQVRGCYLCSAYGMRIYPLDLSVGSIRWIYPLDLPVVSTRCIYPLDLPVGSNRWIYPLDLLPGMMKSASNFLSAALIRFTQNTL